ncbi:MAG: phospholipid carrier-dependent glycosyltransferase, partial [Thermoplasmatales archaeon]|nr:phospholipid carrier-dependent glycosyltransferase [Thermoplasmatales archaeon]
MRQKIISRLKLISENWIFWLILITAIAIIIRSIPAYLNPAWGVDFGIYYGLTNNFIDSKEFFNPYNGWGNSYQYFPVLYAISGISHWITGIGLMEIMPKIAPIFGGLTIPIFYFIVFELLKNRRIAILSAALLSVATFHVYQTSHAAPLTIGHFFMMLSIYFFIK